MSLNVGFAPLGMGAYVILDASGNVVRSHNLSLAGTPSNASDALIQAINIRYRPLREVPLVGGGVLIVLTVI